jgi:hypothetical protein
MEAQWRWIMFGIAVAIGTFGLLVWRFAEPEASSVLRPPPDIPVLTRAEFDATADARLLELVQAEGTRRMLAAAQGWGAGQSVLGPELRALWTIAMIEADLHQSGFAHVLRMSSGPAPMLPPLADLAEAYRAVGQPELAEPVDAAIAAGAQETILAACDAVFRKAIESHGLRAQRVAYARRCRGLVLNRVAE